jgi:ABC-type Mn2+/Zn2+ transport system permease subunit
VAVSLSAVVIGTVLSTALLIGPAATALALATSMTVPVVGALLMFALMIGPAAAARSFTRRPGRAIALATGIALVTVWAGIALSYRTNWPLGFFTGVIAAGFFLLGQGWAAVLRHAPAPRPAPSAAR